MSDPANAFPMATEVPTAPTSGMEDVDAFRARSRRWLAENMTPLHQREAQAAPRNDDDDVQHARDLMARIYEAGFAGICFPKQYGGQGLSVAHMRAWSEEAQHYEMPSRFNTPTMTIIMPTLLDYGSEAQKMEHIPKTLRGEELWVQFLSEPTGGSDLAGAITKATPNGQGFIVNGSKIWSTEAHCSDYCLCLCRTNWDVPKHQGLSMLLLKIHQPGIHVEQIRQVDGSMEFCQEFLDDVAVPLENLVGAEDDGWAVALRLLHHERAAVGKASPFGVTMPMGITVQVGARRAVSGAEDPLVEMTKQLNLGSDPVVRQLVAQGRILSLIQSALVERVSTGIESGVFPSSAGALQKLSNATTGIARSELALEIAGTGAAAWLKPGLVSQQAAFFLGRQALGLAGGSNEIQRNIISERVLGLPREWAPDKGVPFKDVRRNTMPTRDSA